MRQPVIYQTYSARRFFFTNKNIVYPSENIPPPKKNKERKEKKNKQQYMLKLKSAFNRATAEIWCQRMFL